MLRADAMRRVELAHLDEDGHYQGVGPQERVQIEHLFLSPGVLHWVQIRCPEDLCLDVDISLNRDMVARWSGIYWTGSVTLDWAYRKGDRLVLKLWNVDFRPVFARAILCVSS